MIAAELSLRPVLRVLAGGLILASASAAISGGPSGPPAHSTAAGHPQGPKRATVIDPRPGAVFKPVHRDAVDRYYRTEYAGKCPPGLARKNNGCMPPGQARKYAVGRRLPADVVLHPVPQPVVVQLPAVPPGYRYAQVGNDIVLLSPGSGLIVDIISAAVR